MDPVLGTLCLLSIAGLIYIVAGRVARAWRKAQYEIDHTDWAAERAEMQRRTEYVER